MLREETEGAQGTGNVVPFYSDLISFYVKWGDNAYPAGCLVGLKKSLALNVLLNWCLAIVISKEGSPAPA